MGKFYITTTLPYVNANPHIGFAFEIVQADVIARYSRSIGQETFFNTGTDEHGVKIFRKAKEQGTVPQKYVDEYAAQFKRLMAPDVLNIDFSKFIRTTDPAHKSAAQAFWKRCEKNGDIYKKKYKANYCVGCELEKTDSELQDGRCPLHPNLEIESLEEENYFFRFSKYQTALLALYKARPNFIVPASRLTEIQKFVQQGLEDFSISRLKEKMPWGIPVPGDETQVMYVWFDALVNYISTLGWPDDAETFNAFWGTPDAPNAIQIAGKDNLRQQSAMWQAMLMSAELPPSKQILIHGFITSKGKKMSKSLGNVIDPFTLVREYGTNAVRYFLVRHVHPFEDSDVTEEGFKEMYNAHLANGLGNFVSRVLKMAETNSVQPSDEEDPTLMLGESVHNVRRDYNRRMGNFELQKAADVVWGYIGALDAYIQKAEPSKTIKTDPEKAKQDIARLVAGVQTIGELLASFLPDTAQKIQKAVWDNKLPQPLFIRK